MITVKVIILFGMAVCSGMSTPDKSNGIGAPVGGVVGSVLPTEAQWEKLAVSPSVVL